MAEMLFGTLLLSVALFVPGYPFFRAFRFSSISSFIAAPLFSCAVYGVFPLVYYPLGIRCTVASTFGVALILGWGLYLAMRIRGNTTPPARHIHLPQPVGTWIDASRPRELPFDWMLLGLYILCGIVVCSFVFGANLSSADVPYIRYDNQAHLTISKSFLDSGMWSSLHPNRYLDLPLEARSIRSGAISFYPCLLYGITALCSLLSGLTLTAAFNATLFALCAVVFPVGMYGIMRVAFSGKRLIVALGALTTMCFADFPWGIFVRALFPNVAGFCLMTSAIAATMICLATLGPKQAIRPCLLIWVLGVPVLCLAQPNALFTAFIFLVAYLAHIVGNREAQKVHSPQDRLRPRVCGIGAVALVGLLVWLACMNMPFMRYVVHYFGNTIMDPGYILKKLLTLNFDAFYAQHLLALLDSCSRCVVRACLVHRAHSKHLPHALPGWFLVHRPRAHRQRRVHLPCPHRRMRP